MTYLNVCVPVRTELLSLAGKSIGKMDKNIRMATPIPLHSPPPTPCRGECCFQSALLGPALGWLSHFACRWWPYCGSSTPMAHVLWGSVSCRSSSPGSGTALSGVEGKLLPASVRSAQPQVPVPGRGWASLLLTLEETQQLGVTLGTRSHPTHG